MNIGLYDVDSHNFPNLALMKLSAWHKAHGDIVEFVDIEHRLNTTIKSISQRHLATSIPKWLIICQTPMR